MQFFNRLGVNAARLFVAPISDLRTFIGSKGWGINLNNEKVINHSMFLKSINELKQARIIFWANKVFDKLSATTNKITGSIQSSISTLNRFKINTLVVLNIGCSKANMYFEFKSMDNKTSEYWPERWELYKISYALALWARDKGIDMIEFFNEPDLNLGVCLDDKKFKDYYLIRSLSIHDAYLSINQSVKIAASAFARKTYGGDPKRYLGDVCVKNNNIKFGYNNTDLNWNNMELYSYHSYGKTGFYLNFIKFKKSLK